MYRFLATPRWIGFALGMIALSAIMVALGFWQMGRYEERHAINTRIDTAAAAAPVPLASVLSLDHPAGDGLQWTRVTVTGVYDGQAVVARDRTVNGTIGFEILAPLRLADGSTVLVDRGWVPVGPGGATRIPTVPAATTGEVTVTGRVHQPESRSDPPVTVDGALTVRRIAPARLGGALGVDRVYPDYVLLDRQQPAAAPGFTTITADREPSWMNAGYTVQWWAFSLLALVGFGWAARREAHDRRDGIVRTPRGTPGTPSRSRDRVADAELSSHTMR